MKRKPLEDMNWIPARTFSCWCSSSYARNKTNFSLCRDNSFSYSSWCVSLCVIWHSKKEYKLIGLNVLIKSIWGFHYVLPFSLVSNKLSWFHWEWKRQCRKGKGKQERVVILLLTYSLLLFYTQEIKKFIFFGLLNRVKKERKLSSSFATSI